MKGYLDNNVVSAIATDDTEAESEAIDALLALSDDGKISLVTSELTRDEIRKHQGRHRNRIERVFQLLTKVPVVAWDRLLGIQVYHDQYTGINSPIIERDSLYDSLLATGLTPTDVQHVFVAAKHGCDLFVTCDGGVLHRAKDIRSLCGVKSQRPSEVVRDFHSL